MISLSVSGAGLTSVMSWDAAEVMSAPADWMSGCIRGASDSRVNVEFGEGKVKEFAETTVSICLIDDCMMSARAFNSAKASGNALPKRTVTMSDTLTTNWRAGHTLRRHSVRWMLLTVKTNGQDQRQGET